MRFCAGEPWLMKHEQRVIVVASLFPLFCITWNCTTKLRRQYLWASRVQIYGLMLQICRATTSPDKCDREKNIRIAHLTNYILIYKLDQRNPMDFFSSHEIIAETSETRKAEHTRNWFGFQRFEWLNAIIKMTIRFIFSCVQCECVCCVFAMFMIKFISESSMCPVPVSSSSSSPSTRCVHYWSEAELIIFRVLLLLMFFFFSHVNFHRQWALFFNSTKYMFKFNFTYF